MEILGKVALAIIGHSSEEYSIVQNELEDVDDHGDATQAVVFQTAGGKYYEFSYIQQKEWGAMIEDGDHIDCEEVRPVTKTVTIYEAVKNV